MHSPIRTPAKKGPVRQNTKVCGQCTNHGSHEFAYAGMCRVVLSNKFGIFHRGQGIVVLRKKAVLDQGMF